MSSILRFVVFVCTLVPIISRVLLRKLLKRWKLFRNATSKKQEKSTRNLFKCLFYLGTVCALFFRIYRLMKNPQILETLPFESDYIRFVMSLIRAYYVYEIVLLERFSVPNLLWVQHHVITLGIYSISTIASIPFDLHDELLFVSLVLVTSFIFSFNFYFFAGHALARLYPNGAFKAKLYFGLVINVLFTQVVQNYFFWFIFIKFFRNIRGYSFPDIMLRQKF